MKITLLLHDKGWFRYQHAVCFMPTFLKYAAPSDINIDNNPSGGDVLFALHYPALLAAHIRERYKYSVVIHGADLPKGRGRSPIHYQVEAGLNEIPLTMFEIVDEADAGPVYLRDTLSLDGTELLEGIRCKTIRKEIEMVDTFLAQYPMTAEPQTGEPTHYTRRDRECQRLCVADSIASQFDKMRVADNQRYPLWFQWNGVDYELHIIDGRRPIDMCEKQVEPHPPLGYEQAMAESGERLSLHEPTGGSADERLQEM